MKKIGAVTILFFCLLLLAGCGSSGLDAAGLDGLGDEDDAASTDLSGVPSPFEGLDSGDDFEWAKFIRPPYQTSKVRSFPLPVYLAFFDPGEEQMILDGINLANQAVGFEVFEAVDEWSPDARLIYKVNEVHFTEPEAGVDDYTWVVGYTYNRNIYINDKYDAGRVVVDWAVELRDDFFNKWVVAHELGHAMGIQQHALIDYEDDAIVRLEEDSIMADVIGPNPALDDYNYMMEMQGEILLDYMKD